MKPTQKQMNDLYHLASGSQFDDAPREIRDALPFLAMRHDDTEDELDSVERCFPAYDKTANAAWVRQKIALMRDARDAFNAAAVDLIELLERTYAPEPSDRDQALDDADHCNEYRSDGVD